MITVTSQGDFKRTMTFLKRAANFNMDSQLQKYGRIGASALAAATPVESGQTAASWGFEVIKGKGSARLVWTNAHIVNGVPIAIIIQYGHATGTGGYVQGVDYINPALRPLAEQIKRDLWTEVRK